MTTMEEQIPPNCFRCRYASDCYANYGEGTCRYRIAIDQNMVKKRKEDSK